MYRCLVIDDNSFDRKLLRDVARRSRVDLDVVEAENISVAERLIEDVRFDCILLDFRLPGEDGLSFAQRFLAEQSHDAAIVMLTGKGNENLARDAFQIGVLDYLTKENLSPETLEFAVINAVTKTQLQREKEDALRALESSNERLNRFAESAANGLKEPLHHITHALTHLDEALGGSLEADTAIFLEGARHSSGRLHRHIDDMLQHAQLSRVVLSMQSVVLNDVIREVTQKLEALILESGAKISVEYPLGKIEADINLVSLLIENVLKNAIYTTNRDQVCNVSISFNKTSETRWALEFNNAHAHFSESQIRDMFHPFKLASSEEYNMTEVAGFELATCEMICRRHGWDISAHSQEDTGAVFRIAKS